MLTWKRDTRPAPPVVRAEIALRAPLPDGKIAELMIMGGKLTRDDIRYLRRYLDILETALTEDSAT